MRQYLAAIMVAVLSTGSAAAQEVPGEESWKSLTDEPSRADLFALIKATKDADELYVPPLDEQETFGLPASNFQFPRDAINDNTVNPPVPRKAIFGIDVNHYTTNRMDLQKLALENVTFVYAKATQGVSFKDDTFDYYWRGLERLHSNQKIYRGAYHFLSSNSDPKAQADRFVDYVNLHGGFNADDLPPCVDLEWDVVRGGSKDGWASHDGDEIIRWVLTWTKEVEARTGRKPIVYTAKSWWKERIGSEAKFAALSGYGLWIADYSRHSLGTEKPTTPNDTPWILWQFAATASLKVGHSGFLDANQYAGDNFRRDLGLPN